MQIKLAKSAGFCYGVQKAYDLVTEALTSSHLGRYATMHNIVHNPSVMAELESLGLEKVESLDSLEVGDTYVVNAHGDPESIDKAQRRRLNILDTTCCNVRHVQQKARELKKLGYHLVIYGKPNHPEVNGIIYAAGNHEITVVKDLAQATDFATSHQSNQKIGLVSQTTMIQRDFHNLVRYLTHNIGTELRYVDTICSATEKRQLEAAELAGQSNLMIVLGGKQSANTLHLAEICSQLTQTQHIEHPDQLQSEWFADIKRVGITAGASTPKKDIEELIRALEQFS